jgi:hypothetical protein
MAVTPGVALSRLILLQFSSVNQYIAYPATTAFDLDITVDHLGHPHTLVVIGQGDLSSPYSIINNGLHIYDLTNNGAQWQAIDLSAVSGLRGLFSGTLGLSHDNDPQISRSKDGKLLSFFWTDTYLGEGSNNLPNLYGCNYSAAMNLMSGVKEYTSCSDFNGKIYFPRASCDLVSLGDGQYEAPSFSCRQALQVSTRIPLTITI